MDRGAWWATVHGSQRAGHDWVTNTHLGMNTPWEWRPCPSSSPLDLQTLGCHLTQSRHRGSVCVLNKWTPPLSLKTFFSRQLDTSPWKSSNSTDSKAEFLILSSLPSPQPPLHLPCPGERHQRSLCRPNQKAQCIFYSSLWFTTPTPHQSPDWGSLLNLSESLFLNPLRPHSHTPALTQALIIVAWIITIFAEQGSLFPVFSPPICAAHCHQNYLSKIW